MRAVAHDRPNALLAHRSKALGHGAGDLFAEKSRELANSCLRVVHGLAVLCDHDVAQDCAARPRDRPSRVEAHAFDEEAVKRQVGEAQ